MEAVLGILLGFAALIPITKGTCYLGKRVSTPAVTSKRESKAHLKPLSKAQRAAYIKKVCALHEKDPRAFYILEGYKLLGEETPKIKTFKEAKLHLIGLDMAEDADN